MDAECKTAAWMTDRLRTRSRYLLILLLLIAAFFAIAVVNVYSGSVQIAPEEVFGILSRQVGEEEARYRIVWQIRLPRILLSALLGGALALSGFLLQTFFRNPIAGPYVLGISSGAKMTVALVMIYFLERFHEVSSSVLILAALLGSLLVTGFILLLSRRLRQMPVLLIAGIMVGYICTAVTDFIVTFADDSDIVNLHNWSLGSFSGADWDNVHTAFWIVTAAFLLTFLLSKPIGAFQMGEAYAQSVGVNIRLLRVAVILLSSILTASVTPFAGPISFVGTAVPFLIKRVLHTARPIVLIPTLFLGGAVFCMLCDLIARTAFSPAELNVSTVTAVFGAPIVILIMLKKQREY